MGKLNTLTYNYKNKYGMINYLAGKGQLINQIEVFDSLWDEVLAQPYQTNWLRLLRIDLRRLRSAIKLLGPLLPPEGEQWTTFLKNTAAQLGHIREYDVALQECNKYVDEIAMYDTKGSMHTSLPHLTDILKRKREANTDLWLQTATQGWITASLGDCLEVFDNGIPLSEQEKLETNAFLQARLQTWSAKLCNKLQVIHTGTQMHDLHALRIRVKRFRYAYDVYVRDIDFELLEQLKAMQDLLGSVRDGERSISIIEELLAVEEGDTLAAEEMACFKEWRERKIEQRLEGLEEVRQPLLSMLRVASGSDL